MRPEPTRRPQRGPIRIATRRSTWSRVTSRSRADASARSPRLSRWSQCGRERPCAQAIGARCGHRGMGVCPAKFPLTFRDDFVGFLRTFRTFRRNCPQDFPPLQSYGNWRCISLRKRAKCPDHCSGTTTRVPIFCQRLSTSRRRSWTSLPSQ
jgi:hypothetical protein